MEERRESNDREKRGLTRLNCQNHRTQQIERTKRWEEAQGPDLRTNLPSKVERFKAEMAEKAGDICPAGRN